jgi:hypothetical protein
MPLGVSFEMSQTIFVTGNRRKFSDCGWIQYRRGFTILEHSIHFLNKINYFEVIWNDSKVR